MVSSLDNQERLIAQSLYAIKQQLDKSADVVVTLQDEVAPTLDDPVNRVPFLDDRLTNIRMSWR